MTKRDELIALADGLSFAAQNTEGCLYSQRKMLNDASAALRRLTLEAPAAGDGEPVAWRWQEEGWGDYWIYNPEPGWLAEQNNIVKQPLYTAPPADAAMREALEGKLREFDSLWARDGGPFDSEWVSEVLAALTAPGATTKSDVEALAATTAERPGTVTSEPEPSTSDPSSTYTIAHDGFTGTVQGHYVTREGKQGVVLQQVGTRVVHVYGRKWLDGDTASDPSSTRSNVTVDELVEWCKRNQFFPSWDKARALLDQFEIRKRP